jgi:predicted small lipoprotein YifL
MFLPDLAMPRIRPLRCLVALALVASLAACGNKGPLVKPTPKPAPTPPAAATPDTPPKSPDASGH